MSAGHTKGPWSVEEHPHSGHPLVAGEHGYVVADCMNNELAADVEFANARLIAAAPDLLEATQGLVRIVEAMRMTTGLGKTQIARLDAARAAIQKATGGAA